MKIELLIAKLQEIQLNNPGVDVNAYDNKQAEFGNGEFAVEEIHFIDRGSSSYVMIELSPDPGVLAIVKPRETPVFTEAADVTCESCESTYVLGRMGDVTWPPKQCGACGSTKILVENAVSPT